MNTKVSKRIVGDFMGVGSSYLKYDSNWNWLMEVVEKIESFNPNLQSFSINGNRVEIKDFTVKQNLFSYYNDTEKTKIQAVYNACVEFIKWYNEQKKEHGAV